MNLQFLYFFRSAFKFNFNKYASYPDWRISHTDRRHRRVCHSTNDCPMHKQRSYKQ